MHSMLAISASILHSESSEISQEAQVSVVTQGENRSHVGMWMTHWDRGVGDQDGYPLLAVLLTCVIAPAMCPAVLGRPRKRSGLVGGPEEARAFPARRGVHAQDRPTCTWMTRWSAFVRERLFGGPDRESAVGIAAPHLQLSGDELCRDQRPAIQHQRDGERL